MQIRIITAVLILLVMTRVPVAGNLEHEQKVAQLEAKLKTASGKEKVDTLEKLVTETYYHFPRKCTRYSRHVLELTENGSFPAQRANVLVNFGNALWTLGERESPFLYAREALAIYEKLQDKRGIANAMRIIGTFYKRKDFYNLALDYLLKSLKAVEELGDDSSLIYPYFEIAGLYGRMEDYPKAMSYSRKGLALVKPADSPRAAIFINSIATVHLRKKEFKDALAHYRNALEIFEKAGNKDWISNVLINIAEVHLETGSTGPALESLSRALSIKEELGSKFGISTALYFTGLAYMKRKDYTHALPYFHRSAEIMREMGDKGSLQLLYQSYSGLYAATGDYRTALDYYKQFAQTRDDLLNQEKTRHMAELEVQFEAEKKEKEILLLTNTGKIQRITRNASIGGFILVSIILLLLFKKYLYLFAFWKKQKYIGQYRLMESLGSGGMGTVSLAHTVRDKKQLAAVKVLREELVEDENSRRRFKQEGSIIDKLDHPNIVKTFERGEYKGKLYIAMEYLQGRTLAQKIKEEENIPIARCLSIMEQVAGAMAFIHGKNIVHRDMKPANVMLVEHEGNLDFVKLLDFGVALMEAQTRLTQSGMLVGTIHYTAPEQITDNCYTAAGDIYSMGVTFYQLLAGIPVFAGDAITTLVEKILGEIPRAPGRLRPGIPGELNQLIMAMLSKTPGQRPSSSDIVTALGELTRETAGKPTGVYHEMGA